ncbi:MAG: hypothetical protein JWM41_1061 [Gemmatimonadetes bacterium]|nr:hypothetical protein [Gemmatimonadota bacterium]
MAAFALLGWLLGTSVFPSTGRRVERATEATVAARLAAWTRTAPNVALHGDFATTPETWAIDWLAALGHGGHAVSWSGSPPAVAMSAEALSDPSGGTRIDVAAPAGARVLLRDDASVIDSVHVARFGASVLGPVVVGPIVATTSGQRFSVAPPDSVHTRSIVVIGAAGWEGKFIVSALEERGWPVSARFSVAPNVDVAQGGAALSLDTSRVAAVIAIDTTIARYGDAIARFVHSGGGLVLAGPAGLTASVMPLAPGALGARLRPAVQPKDTIGLGSTGFYPVSALRNDGVVLERRSSGIAVAARRVGAGRVIEIGYDDSWRWRMAGAAGSERAHREWWSRVVGSVAYVGEAAASGAALRDESAPLARLVDRLGPARAVADAGGGSSWITTRLLMTLIMLLLLAEWASRRLRGLR